MKSLKVITALLPMFIIAGFIYLSSIGASSDVVTTGSSSGITTKEIDKPSEICTIAFSIASLEPGCLSGTYKVCVNGGPGVTYGTFFSLDLECGGTYTICVSSTSGNCNGSKTIEIPCPCQAMGRQTIVISSENAPCGC